jgi:hypothetical protein
MTHIKLIDCDVMLPPDVVLSTEPPSECRVLHTLEGASVLEVQAAIEQAAASRGYAIRRLGSDSLLERNGQRIEIFATSPSRLRIRVDDPEGLPYSSITEDGISIGGVSIALRGAPAIQSGRERHDEGSTSWTAEWRVHGKKADELASEVHESLLQQGLRSNGVWAPPKGGIQRWRVEAYSPQRLVKATISDEGEYLALSVTLVDNTERA